MNKIRSILTLAVLLPLFAWTETPPLEPAGPPGPAEPAEPPAPPPPGKEKVPPPRRGPAERFNWRAFSRLTEAERTELFKLQRSDPDKFREELRRRGEELRRQEIARMEELRQLTAFQYTSPDTERESLLSVSAIQETKNHCAPVWKRPDFRRKKGGHSLLHGQIHRGTAGDLRRVQKDCGYGKGSVHDDLRGMPRKSVENSRFRGGSKESGGGGR